jgi:hypothetical protein
VFKQFGFVSSGGEIRRSAAIQLARLNCRDPGIYRIRAVPPEEDGRHPYRIKSLIEPHERVVPEHEFA